MSKKFRWLVGVILTISLIPVPITKATNCPDIKIIFARGSGEKRWVDQNYLTFRSELEQKLKLIKLTYEFEDLDYPAIDVGNLWTLLSAYISGGESYDFGASVDAGVKNLISEVNYGPCKNTKFIVAGYSQGAMVVSKAAEFLDSNKIVYAATFGDPKIYLPEGFGITPSACKGKNLSNYRIYVPDCRAYEGILGGYKPYQPEGLFDKMGTWCNKMDILCSSHYSLNSHLSYISDGLYTDASKFIFAKICEAFELKNNYVSLHDTAILIDSTGSMEYLIENYKTEALRLAEQTFESGGRVALYDYRDIGVENYGPVCHCDFETCTLENFGAKLNEITLGAGGDLPESLLSASFHMMKKLSWKYGSTKSVVVLTDAGFHNPDFDGVGFDEVVALSKSIDPVNFYVITPEAVMQEYSDLAETTDGKVVSSASDLSILTDNIMARYDSLPRVEEDFANTPLPEISEILVDGDNVNFKNTGTSVLVILNDAILGITEENSITISDLDYDSKNLLRLVPLTKDTRGLGVEVELGNYGRGELNLDIAIPKAPNAGRQ